MGYVAVGMASDEIANDVVVFVHLRIEFLLHFGSFHGIACHGGIIHSIKDCHYLLFIRLKALAIGVVDIHGRTAFHGPMLHLVHVGACNRRVLVFREEWEDATAFILGEFDHVGSLRVVGIGSQYGCLVGKDGGVDDHVITANGLEEVDGLVVSIVKVERHLELFGFVAAAKNKHSRKEG